MTHAGWQLTQIPEGWQRRSAKSLYLIRLGKMLQNEPATKSDRLVRHLKAAHVQWDTVSLHQLPEMWVSPQDIERYGVRDGDLLVCEGGEVGRAAILRGLHGTCIIQNSLHRVRPRAEADTRFFKYALEHLANAGWFEVLCNKATISHLTVEKVGAIPLLVPTAKIQCLIATFLDRKTTVIDQVIQKKEQLIKLLQEKRHAVISQAVTKGLDSRMPMKESGVEWIGRFPAHWSLRRLKQISKRVVVGIAQAATHAYADSGVPLIRSTNVRPGRIFVDDLLYIEKGFADQLRSKYISPGDLLTVRTGNAGVTAVVPPELPVSHCFTMLITTLRRDHLPHFFSAQLNSELGTAHFRRESWGTAQENISVPILQNTPVLVPPPSEQRDILTTLNERTRHFDAALAAIERQTQVLREYRKTLISAAVTGQIDVTGEAA